MKRFIYCLFQIIKAYFVVVGLLGVIYLFVPPYSTLMLGHLASLQSISYSPVPLKHISAHLTRAVIRAEDARFCQHSGVDWESMANTIEEGGMDGPKRGASTIAMQVAKNLFLWPQQSYIRKAIEIPLALYLNAIWPKSRMMEVYLSVAEWGDGIYGAEAASQHYFHKPAIALNRMEAALLAAALPNPKQRDPRHASGYYGGYAHNILKWSNADVDMSCLR